ncbi:MAG: glycosyltransferase family 39 protein [Saprospiraceae bacterium]|nr:glycosyltransferase family 39 protein [Saprospiraceae bacterium]
MDDPLLPLLRAEPLVPYDDKAWCCNHIWVHKQPLFMWQMTASMAIFGVSEFAMRYPSVLMGCLMILLCFRITMLLTQHWMTSIVAALIMTTSNYHLEQVSGWIGMDQNDVAFSFYILASIWAYAEFKLKNQFFGLF